MAGMMMRRTTMVPTMTLVLRLAAPGPLERDPPKMSIMHGIIPPAMISRDCVRHSRGGESPNIRLFTMDTHLQSEPHQSGF